MKLQRKDDIVKKAYDTAQPSYTIQVGCRYIQNNIIIMCADADETVVAYIYLKLYIYGYTNLFLSKKK